LMICLPGYALTILTVGYWEGDM